MPAIEENPNAPEHMPAEVSPRNPAEIVAQFRADLDYWFVRYNNFYNRANAAMRDYRFGHLDLVTRVFNELMGVFGDSIDGVQTTNNDLTIIIENRRSQLGEANACLNGVTERQTANVASTSSTIQLCGVYANNTMARLLTNVFYPAFAGIQTTISTVPTAVVDVLARGNVLEDEQAIVEYLRAGYGVIEFQWLSAVSQLLRWESNRFEVDGMFLVDEMSICMTDAVIRFLDTNFALERDALACS